MASTTTIALTEGQTLFFKITTAQMGVTADVPFTVTLPTSESTGDDTTGDVITPTGTGVQTDPYIITEGGNYVANVVEGGYVYYQYTATENVTLTLTFTGDNYYLESGTFNFNLCNPSSAAVNELSVMQGNTLYIKVSANEGATIDVPFTISIA